MTATEQDIVNLAVHRYEVMQEKYKLRKQIAALRRVVVAKVAAGDLEGINHECYSEADVVEGGDPEKITNTYTTDEMEDLYREFHNCSGEISITLSAMRYQCKKYAAQKTANK